MPWQLEAFAAALVIFHASEFALAATFTRDQLSFKSFLFSKPYVIAMSAGVFEFLLTVYLAPGLKLHLTALSVLGLALMATGELIRKMGMLTAQGAFTHDIQHALRPGHRLVNHGIYRYIRHPGYLGWFIWAVATQLLLVNPCCFIAFTIVCWRFFSQRIAYEERTLRRMFGPAYIEYAAATPTWIYGIP